MSNEFLKVTEAESRYRHLENMSVIELLENINQEDQVAVGLAIIVALFRKRQTVQIDQLDSLKN